MKVEEMRLARVQEELRAISGTPIRDEAERLRRMALWRQLDVLVNKRSEERGAA